MIELWRAQLYFLGFLASSAFAARFVFQWISSEKCHKSHVTPLFWKLSLLGNILFALHSIIQVQIHICIVQLCSAVFSWRNLNFMKRKKQRASFKTVVFLLCGSVLLSLGIFIVQAKLLYGSYDWVRTPTMPWSDTPGEKLSTAWHLMGSFGIFLFSSRFYVQWRTLEKKRKSSLEPSFWWISIIGSLFSLLYFIRMTDAVNIIGQTLSLFPAIRNLQLIYKAQKKHEDVRTRELS